MSLKFPVFLRIFALCVEPRRWVQWAVALTLLACAIGAPAQSVLFINPGKSNEAYWLAAAQVMEQAARSLNMDLEVIYAERNRLKPLEVTKQILQRPKERRPEYVVLTNDYSAAPELLRSLEGAGIKVFMAFSGIKGDVREQTGRPRERYPFWLGSLEPRAADAGYLTAKALIEKARTLPQLRAADGKLYFLAIAGDRSTTASTERNQGMRRAVQEAPDVVFTQEVYADWRRDLAQEQAKVLYKRYPNVRLVWAGSDQVVFGAMEAWRQQGGEPGKDALFSGVNTSQEALNARRRGELTALAGGHFMAGAWSLVMLHDYAKGIDFAAEGLEQEYPMFMLLDERNIPVFEARFVQMQQKMDFKVFSKAHNPRITKYDFDIARLLR